VMFARCDTWLEFSIVLIAVRWLALNIVLRDPRTSPLGHSQLASKKQSLLVHLCDDAASYCCPGTKSVNVSIVPAAAVEPQSRSDLHSKCTSLLCLSMPCNSFAAVFPEGQASAVAFSSIKSTDSDGALLRPSHPLHSQKGYVSIQWPRTHLRRGVNISF